MNTDNIGYQTLTTLVIKHWKHWLSNPDNIGYQTLTTLVINTDIIGYRTLYNIG